MAFKPPQHTIDHTPIYVSVHDPAWDSDRIMRECVTLAKNQAREKAARDGVEFDETKKHEGVLGDHPVFGPYLRGETRYDLDAEGAVLGATVKVRDYLTGVPTEFRLRRLTPDEMALSNDMEAKAGRWKAAEVAIRYGLVEATGLDIVRGHDGRLTDGSLWLIMDAVSSTLGAPAAGPSVMQQIGTAIRMLSRGLTVPEKKA